MKRWNISHVIYYSKHGQNRVLEFQPEKVTIITGASRTGKTYLIETIDYCLCSSGIELSNFVKNKITHVAVKWVKDNTEFLVAREISRISNSSSQMYLEVGNKIKIPDLVTELKGKGNEKDIRNELARLFGIIEFKEQEDDGDKVFNNVSIRQLTPFLILDKEVIDSRKIILHGLDEPQAAKHIIAAMPYFLGAITIDELEALREIKRLKKAIEGEEKKEFQFNQYRYELNKKSHSLMNEAIQVGLIQKKDIPKDSKLIIQELKSIIGWQPSQLTFENEELLNEIQNKNDLLITEINNLRKKRIAAMNHEDLTNPFQHISKKQLSKLEVKNIFKFNNGACPICNSKLEASSEAAVNIEKSFEELKNESSVVNEHRPRLGIFISDTYKKIEELQNKWNLNDREIQNLIKESEIAQKQQTTNQQILRVIGRISYFLDNHKEIELFNTDKLKQYKQKIEDLESRYGSIQRAEKIQKAERQISNLATKNLEYLPIEEIYKNNSLNFFSKKSTITLTNMDTGSEETFKGIGSDENYLSIHLAFTFALQKFFEIKKSPVPGILILDQVSRPYYPKDKDDLDIVEDEDRDSLEKHFNFIFDQVEKQTGLQVIVLEHAYLYKNKRYTDAVKYRWPRSSSERLIPSDWPDR